VGNRRQLFNDRRSGNRCFSGLGAGNLDAAGAAGGELMARAILATMYPGREASELAQDDNEIVSALASWRRNCRRE